MTVQVEGSATGRCPIEEGRLIRSDRVTPPPRFMSRALMAALCKIEPGQTDSNLERVCRALVRRAMDGNVAACRLIFDLLEPLAQRGKGVDLGRKPPARTIPADWSKLTAAEASRLYQELLRDPAYGNDDDDLIH